ncbi:unnamed protein product [Ceratitis capitata]|uniref:(Mediterranean fruit fly) hypothetical protein n=1 Tax=Ceratitis capitata TaxID=7213 RepID=A0A811URI6_CERCA|nr:unnamed protein product [Ceratitis capitata]
MKIDDGVWDYVLYCVEKEILSLLKLLKVVGKENIENHRISEVMITRTPIFSIVVVVKSLLEANCISMILESSNEEQRPPNEANGNTLAQRVSWLNKLNGLDGGEAPRKYGARGMYDNGRYY